MTARIVPPVAVIADAHFHDIESDFDFSGVVLQGRRLCLRSWADTATAGRAFNESGAALRATLAAIRDRGIRHVVLLGDYTDDGQIETTARLAALLRHERDRHGLSFYAIPGNHDVFGPLGKHTATRFVTAPGRTALVTSDAELAATEPDAVLTGKMRCEGQPEGLLPMAEFGLFRQAEYLHWETPFGLSDNPEHRLYPAHSADGLVTRHLMDASYLVEPEAGLWLLMIDANVFEPRVGQWRITQKRAFIDPAAAGWNAVLRVKPFLLHWIADVCARADRWGKTLLAFSHYPAADPFEDWPGAETALFGETEVARRTPGPAVAEALSAAGLRHHVSGHVHAQGTTRSGRLTNVSVPSPVAVPAGFMILRANGTDLRTDAVSLADLPLDPQIMVLYRSEAQQAAEALDAPDFGSLLAAQLRARIAAHVLPREWPPDLAAQVPGASALDLACLMLGQRSLGDAPDPAVIEALAARITGTGLTRDDLADCDLADLIADWYLLRQAGAMAPGWVPEDRLHICRCLAETFADPTADPSTGDRAFFARFLAVLAVSLRRMDSVRP